MEAVKHKADYVENENKRWGQEDRLQDETERSQSTDVTGSSVEHLGPMQTETTGLPFFNGSGALAFGGSPGSRGMRRHKQGPVWEQHVSDIGQYGGKGGRQTEGTSRGHAGLLCDNDLTDCDEEVRNGVQGSGRVRYLATDFARRA